MIPRIIHSMWIGDQSKRPTQTMNTWAVLNPSCQHIVWTEENLTEFTFANQHVIDDMAELNGKCDIMRYEILQKYGGFFVDADAECVNTLDDFFFENERFTCYEHERYGIDEESGLPRLSSGYLAFCPQDPFLAICIAELGKVDVVGKQAWEVVSNKFLAVLVNKYKEEYPMTIYPSWYFIPKHAISQPWNDVEYKGADKIYAKHLWGSTFGLYGTDTIK